MTVIDVRFDFDPELNLASLPDGVKPGEVELDTEAQLGDLDPGQLAVLAAFASTEVRTDTTGELGRHELHVSNNGLQRLRSLRSTVDRHPEWPVGAVIQLR